MHKLYNAGCLSRILVVCIVFGSAYAQPRISFVKENVAIDLTASRGCVCGKYTFQNLNEAASQLPIFFPITVTQDCAAPEDVEVYFAGEPLMFAFGPDGKSIRFQVTMEALSENILEIHYCQPLTGHTFTYITTTLHGWGQPLDEALFEITCPREWSLDISYPVEHIETNSDYKIYTICQTSFYPDEDLTIYWSKKQAKEKP